MSRVSHLDRGQGPFQRLPFDFTTKDLRRVSPTAPFIRRNCSLGMGDMAARAGARTEWTHWTSVLGQDLIIARPPTPQQASGCLAVPPPAPAPCAVTRGHDHTSHFAEGTGQLSPSASALLFCHPFPGDPTCSSAKSSQVSLRLRSGNRTEDRDLRGAPVTPPPRHPFCFLLGSERRLPLLAAHVLPLRMELPPQAPRSRSSHTRCLRTAGPDARPVVSISCSHRSQ